jgi:CubicO group peptidase (beta-lactamase class C family)
VDEALEIHGRCDTRFAPVRKALADNFRRHGEVGAAVAITLAGRPVVDLWAGWTDAARTRPWREDTLVNVFSVGKPMAALCVLMLAERGAIALDAPVARWWPEFAAAGKDAITVRMLLAHRAGLPAVREPLPALAMYDRERMAAALATEAPWWEPGRRHGYHVNTFGFLVGELVRRVSGERIGAFFRRAVAAPLAADFHFGLAPADEARVAEHLLPDFDERVVAHVLASDPPAAERAGRGESGGDSHAAGAASGTGPGHATAGSADDDAIDGDGAARRLLVRHVYFNPPGLSGFGTVNTRAWRAAEMPSTNGHATARAVARIYGALACGGALDGVRVVQAGTLAEATAEASAGRDAVLRRTTRFGLGFQLNRAERPLGPSPRSFGHFGVGGALGFADPDARLGFAYAMNLPGPRWQDPRNRALVDALYASL